MAHWPDNRLVATFRLQTTRTPNGLLRCLEREYGNFPGPRNAATRHVLHAWAAALLADMAGAAPLPTFSEMEGLEGADMTTIAQARLGKWFEDFRAKNVAEGIALGIEQGVERGIEQGVERGIRQGVERGIRQGVERGIEQANGNSATRLRRQAAIKFGEAVAKRLAELLGRKPTAPELDQVGVWLMECATGAELLRQVEKLRRP